jgi:hypothetical protein
MKSSTVQVRFYDFNLSENAIVIFISFLSMIGSMFVATMIFSSKKLQAHPQRLIAFTCMSEGISSLNGAIWAMGTEKVITYLDLHTLFAYSVYFSRSEASRQQAL